MNFDLEFWKRNFTEALQFPEVEFEVQWYSWAAMGGPEEARATAYGNGRELWNLLAWLRAPVEVVDEDGSARWWGMLNEATVRVGGIEVGVSLKRMANRVAVAYSYVAPGSNSVGTRATTAWSQNDDAVTAYGIKEMLASVSGATATAAETARDRILAERRFPMPVVRQAPGRGSLSASLVFRGWWDTLGWQRYAQAAGLVSHEDGSSSQAVGELAGNEEVAESLTLAAAGSWEVSSIWLKVAKVASPADTLYAELFSDSAGAPNALLSSGSVSASAMETTATWTEFVLGTPVTVSYGVTYWVKVRRSGSVDPVNYCEVTVDEGLGYVGILRLWNGSAWVARSPDADLTFKLTGEWETTRQIEEAVDADGEFMTGVDLVDDSGVWSSQYRDGDSSVLQVVKELLDGGTSNDRRLLATVTRGRGLRVYEEPERPDDAGDAEVFLGSDGQVRTAGDALVTRECPVGVWCALKDVVPPSLDMSLMADPSLFFVERSEFRVGEGTLLLGARGEPSVWDLGRIGE